MLLLIELLAEFVRVGNHTPEHATYFFAFGQQVIVYFWLDIFTAESSINPMLGFSLFPV